MHLIIRGFTVLSFTLSTLPFANAGTPSDRAFLQYATGQVLSRTLAMTSQIKTVPQAAKVFALYIPKKDQAFFDQQIKQLKSFPKITRLNRGFTFTIEGQKFAVTVVNIFKNEYLINDKVPFTFSPTNSLQLQAEALAQKLSKESTTAFRFLIPEANALGPLAFMLVGCLLTLAVNTVSNYVIANIIQPTIEETTCDGADPTKYSNVKRCADYFRFMESQRKGIPNAVATERGRTQIPMVAKAPKCYSKDSPTYQQDFDLLDKQITVRRIINYDQSGRATEMVEQQIRPFDASKKLTYKLNDKGQLLEIYNVDKLLATRDPQKSELITKDGLEFLKPFDAVIENVIASLKLCEPEIQDKLERAADQSASGPVSVLTSDEATVSAPGDAGTKTTK